MLLVRVISVSHASQKCALFELNSLIDCTFTVEASSIHSHDPMACNVFLKFSSRFDETSYRRRSILQLFKVFFPRNLQIELMACNVFLKFSSRFDETSYRRRSILQLLFEVVFLRRDLQIEEGQIDNKITGNLLVPLLFSQTIKLQYSV